MTATYGEDTDQLIGVDETLFRLYTPHEDPYSEATKYYRPQLSQRRRGLDWWVAQSIISPIEGLDRELEIRKDERRVRLYGATEGYNIGTSGSYAKSHREDRPYGWNSYLNIDFRTGRDMNIEGVFRQDLRSKFQLSREFRRGGYLSLAVEVPILMRGLQSDASQEAVTLTGDNLYNPAWGLYDGKVRNSRVANYSIPEFKGSLKLPLSDITTLNADLTAEFGRRSVSRLGWYDAYNPTPDYYRKLPSYIEPGELHADVEALWRAEATEYTQIAWDRLVEQNQLSADGTAHYALEDQVQRVAKSEVKILLRSSVAEGVTLTYGAQIKAESSRFFKEMDDLLGAEYLVDHDLYIGDYINLNTDLQNDLHNPDRRIMEGDRFGYDYSLTGVDMGGVLGFRYRNDGLDINLLGEFGTERISRMGHYEKERFEGNSYGQSKVISLPSSSVDLRVTYSPNGRHHLSLKGLYHQLPIDKRDLFIQSQSANRMVDNPTSRNISSLGVGYAFKSANYSLDIDAYLLYSRDETQVWSYYDDLSATYSDIVVSGVGSRSVGVDIVSRWKISRALSWDVALALGDYSYDRAPLVTLYDDHDMELLSTSRASTIEGCKVGNAPQILATSSLTYFVDYGLILSFDSSYGGGRYIAPSFARRTDRVIYGAASPEMREAITAQERLGAVFDVTLSATKIYWLRDDDRLSFTFRVNNLLGDKDRVEYGRESNRVLKTTGGTRYLEPSSYIYSVPRGFYLSCSYLF